LDHNEKNWIPFQREGKTYVARNLREPQGTAEKTWQKDAKGIYGISMAYSGRQILYF